MQIHIKIYIRKHNQFYFMQLFSKTFCLSTKKILMKLKVKLNENISFTK